MPMADRFHRILQPGPLGVGVQCLLGLTALAVVTLGSWHFQPESPFATTALIYLLVIALLSLSGSFICAAVASLIAVFSLEYLFRPPLYTVSIGGLRDAVALLVFLTTALVITSLVSGMRASLSKLQAVLDERNERDAQLRESERRYRNIFQTAPASVWEQDFSGAIAALNGLDMQGAPDLQTYLTAHPQFVREALARVRTLDVNDAAIRLLEARDKDELLLASGRLFMSECDQTLRGVLLAVAQGHSHFETEMELQTLRGTKLTVLLAVSVPPDPAVSSVLVRLMDITARRQAEEALREAQTELAHVSRLTTLGELAASIAHEMNQPLAAIVADAQACLNWLAMDSPNLAHVRETLTAIVKDSHRAADVLTGVRRLLSRSTLPYEPFDLCQVVEDALPLVRAEFARHGIVTNTSLATDLPLVLGNRTQLGQVLLNLLMNAADASKEVPAERRHLRVRTRTEHDGERINAVVEVQDSGIGILDPQPPNLYDPFYTTKPGGLGMGLSISRSIIEQHGGRLWATANPDHGVTFHFAVPGLP